MKIILGAIYHFSQYAAGNERYTHELALGLTEKGNQVIYVTTSPQPPSSYPYQIITLKNPSLFGHPLLSLSWIDFAFHHQADIFHACGSGLPLILSSIIFRLRGIKTLFTYPAPFRPRSPWLIPLIWIIERLIYPLAFSGFLATQPLNQQLLQKRYPKTKVFCAWLNLASSFLDPSPAKTFAFPHSHNHLKLLMVSKLDHHHYYKGVEVALNALALLPSQYHLYLVGDGDRLTSYQSLSKKLKVEQRVFFLGHLPDDSMPSVYRSADLFLFPSLSNAEGFGLSLFEAMSQQTPTITTTAIGLYPYLKEQNITIFVEPHSSLQLSQAIQKQISTPNRSITKRAAVFARKLSLSQMTHDTLKAYQSLS